MLIVRTPSHPLDAGVEGGIPQGANLGVALGVGAPVVVAAAADEHTNVAAPSELPANVATIHGWCLCKVCPLFQLLSCFPFS